MKTPEQFLCAMRDRYGISEEFVSAGRPLVDTIFAEFDGTQRADLLEFAESVFAQQAATEQSVRSTVGFLQEAAGQLERAVADFSRAFEQLQQAVVERPFPARPLVSRWQLN
jgi:hypothetical protein